MAYSRGWLPLASPRGYAARRLGPCALRVLPVRRFRLRQAWNMGRLARRLGVPIVIQSAGTGATLLLTLALARYAGPDTQAVFAKFRYWTDLAISIALFGLPQAYVYLINKDRISGEDLSQMTILYSLFITPIVLLFSLVSLNTGLLEPVERIPHVLTASLIAFGVGTLVYQRLERSIRLTRNDELGFSVVTALPALSLLFVYLFWFKWGSTLHYDVLYAAAALISTAAAIFIGRPKTGWRPTSLGNVGNTLRAVGVVFPMMARHSSHSFFQAVLYAAQPAAAIWLLQAMGGSLADVSFFNIAALAVVLCNLLFQYLSPLAFNIWSKDDRVLDLGITRNRGFTLSISVGLLFALAMPLLPWAATFGLGSAYAKAGGAMQIFALTAAPVVFTRFMSPAVHASGRPHWNTASSISRIGSALLVQLILTKMGLGPLAAASFGWLAGEWMAAALTLLLVSSLHQGPTSSSYR